VQVRASDLNLARCWRGARDVAAAGFVLGTPIRPKPTLASVQQTTNGYGHRR
jgi:hypothetical protein